MASQSRVSPKWYRRSIPLSAAAGALGAALCLSSAGIEVARAWTSEPYAGAEAGHVVGGMIVALFGLAGFGFATRARVLAVVTVAASFALLAKGGTLVLEGETVGAMLLGLAPMVFLLSQVAFAVPRATRESLENARMLELWRKTSRRRPSALAVVRAVFPIPLAMRASQATIIDGLAMTPSASYSGPTTLRSCDSTA